MSISNFPIITKAKVIEVFAFCGYAEPTDEHVRNALPLICFDRVRTSYEPEMNKPVKKNDVSLTKNENIDDIPKPIKGERCASEPIRKVLEEHPTWSTESAIAHSKLWHDLTDYFAPNDEILVEIDDWQRHTPLNFSWSTEKLNLLGAHLFISRMCLLNNEQFTGPTADQRCQRHIVVTSNANIHYVMQRVKVDHLYPIKTLINKVRSHDGDVNELYRTNAYVRNERYIAYMNDGCVELLRKESRPFDRRAVVIVRADLMNEDYVDHNPFEWCEAQRILKLGRRVLCKFRVIDIDYNIARIVSVRPLRPTAVRTEGVLTSIDPRHAIFRCIPGGAVLAPIHSLEVNDNYNESDLRNVWNQMRGEGGLADAVFDLCYVPLMSHSLQSQTPDLNYRALSTRVENSTLSKINDPERRYRPPHNKYHRLNSQRGNRRDSHSTTQMRMLDYYYPSERSNDAHLMSRSLRNRSPSIYRNPFDYNLSMLGSSRRF